MPEETNAQPAKPALYAVLELFGHARIAGAVSEQTFGGASLVRVDVPEVKLALTDYDAPLVDGARPKKQRTIAAHTRSFGAGAIYSINWCDETTAILAAHSIQHEPLSPYSVREALASMPELRARLPSPRAVGVDDEDRDEIPY